jgi:LPXTG-motif cell wall-anchored protein
MIQRIQTVFFFFAFVFVGLLFFMPFSGFISGMGYNLSLMGIAGPDGVAQIQQPYWLTTLGAVELILILIIIFLYKKRKLQMKLTLVALVTALLLNGAMYWVTNNYKIVLASEPSYKAVFVFPAIAAILLFLAHRSINKDERLIKSLDRLR